MNDKTRKPPASDADALRQLLRTLDAPLAPPFLEDGIVRLVREVASRGRDRN